MASEEFSRILSAAAVVRSFVREMSKLVNLTLDDVCDWLVDQGFESVVPDFRG